MTRALDLAAITDEFSPDLATAIDAMAGVGVTGAELRVIDGRNVLDLDNDELTAARRTIEARGLRTIGVATPLYKCELPGGPPPDPAVMRDVFGARHTFADQARLADRAFEVAERMGAPLLRVFWYWRTVEPARCLAAVVDTLGALADRAGRRGLVIGLENEHACNVATGAEAATLLAALDHPALGLIWDPANALVQGERAFPDGYRRLPPARIVHVHAKDCTVTGGVPTWGLLGTMDVGWADQIRALVADGYRGAVSLETHWNGPEGRKLEGSRLCALALRDLIESA